MFDLSDMVSNRDNCLLPFYLLKEAFKQKEFALATSDIHSIETSDIVIYNEMTKKLPRLEDYHKSYLLLFESELILPDNWDVEKHRSFDKIFTWHDHFVDDEKYFKINFSHEIPEIINKNTHRKKFCTIIEGNKHVQHPLELYSKRMEVIGWFEKKHPQDFDLYGIGWDEYCFSGSKFLRVLNRCKPLTRFLAKHYPSYKGRVKNKKETLGQYRLSICYENAKDISGYITEKIFDCFLRVVFHCIGGANNISEHISENCLIDMRKFSKNEDMYQYMKAMSDDECLNYLDAIEDFIHSNQVKKFSADYFSKTIVEQVVK